MATGGVVRWAVGSFTSSGVPQCVHLCYRPFSVMCFMPRNGDQKSKTKIAATWSLGGPLRGWEGDILGVHSFWALGPQRLTTQKGKFHLSSYPSLYPSTACRAGSLGPGGRGWGQGRRNQRQGERGSAQRNINEDSESKHPTNRKPPDRGGPQRLCSSQCGLSGSLSL